jgi:hypothetical protein
MMLEPLKGVYALTRVLPNNILKMIALFILSTGTPHSNAIRKYIDRVMYILPPQRSDDVKTLWRYQMYLHQYRLMDNVTRMSVAQYVPQQVHYEFVLALLESDDCAVRLASRSDAFINGLKIHIEYTLTKLVHIHLHRIMSGPQIKPSPSACVIKKWFNKKKTPLSL